MKLISQCKRLNKLWWLLDTRKMFCVKAGKEEGIFIFRNFSPVMQTKSKEFEELEQSFIKRRIKTFLVSSETRYYL